MSWTAGQRRLLDALGYELLVPGRVGAASAAAAPATVPLQAANLASTADAAPARAPAAGARLLEALRRAAGGADPSALAGDLERLRRDPAAKRALWPRLRALRRNG